MEIGGRIERKPKLTFTSDLVSWLNQDSPSYRGKPTKMSRTRILTLLNAIRRATTLLCAAVEAEPDRNYWEDPPTAIQETLAKIEDMLGDYPMWPTVEIRGQFGESGLHFDHATGPGRPLGEQVAAWGVVELAQSRRLDLIRQCACGKWFFAKRNDQKACTPICRHKAYEQTDAYKAMRREYMRVYYALKKSGKVR
jgi:hypothetical protein